jgi:hypothetical protein
MARGRLFHARPGRIAGMDENPYQSPELPATPPRARLDGDAQPVTLRELLIGILILTSSMIASVVAVLAAKILMNIFR